MGSNTSEALTKFEMLAQRIFPPAKGPQTLLQVSWDLLRNIITDNRYDSSVLDETLQTTFGGRRLFTSANFSGPRVALTASHISDGQLCIFTNYRGIGRATKPSAYRVIVPQVPSEEPCLWEA